LGKIGVDGLLHHIQTHDQTTASDANEGKVVFALQDAATRQQFERLLSDLGVVPDYRLNRSLLVLDSIRFLQAVRSQHPIDEAEWKESLQRDCPHLAQAIGKTGDVKGQLLSLLKQGATAAAARFFGDMGAEVSKELVVLAFHALRDGKWK